MNTNELCSICGEGHVTNNVDQVASEYRGTKALVPMHYKTCDLCGSDFASADESRLNKRAVLAFHKKVDGLLTGAEISALRGKYGINQKQAARLFGGGPVAFSKYENDDVAQSQSMDKLLRLALDSKEAFQLLVEHAGMSHELNVSTQSKSIVITHVSEAKLGVPRWGNYSNAIRNTIKPTSTFASETHLQSCGVAANLPFWELCAV